MTDKFSAVVVTEVAHWAAMRALGIAAGFDPGEGIPLSSDNGESVTHRGLRANASPELKAILDGAVKLEIPGVTQEQFDAVVGSMIKSFYPPGGATNRLHFNEVLAANNLVKWIDPALPLK